MIKARSFSLLANPERRRHLASRFLMRLFFLSCLFNLLVGIWSATSVWYLIQEILGPALSHNHIYKQSFREQMSLTISPFIGNVSDTGGGGRGLQNKTLSSNEVPEKKVSCAGIRIDIAPFPLERSSRKRETWLRDQNISTGIYNKDSKDTECVQWKGTASSPSFFRC